MKFKFYLSLFAILIFPLTSFATLTEGDLLKIHELIKIESNETKKALERLEIDLKREILDSEKRTREYIDLKIEAQDAKIDRRLSIQEAKIDALGQKMDDGFEAVDQRFEAVDQRFEAVDRDIELMIKVLTWLMILVGAIIGIPQILIAYKELKKSSEEKRMKLLEEKVAQQAIDWEVFRQMQQEFEETKIRLKKEKEKNRFND